jgi:ABC-type multidrug transport system fused ATPase/permease subunit
MAEPPRRKLPSISTVWRETRSLVWEHRGRLAIGLLLIGIGRLSGLVLPASSKFLIDEVIGKQRADLLLPLAAAVGAATLVSAVASFTLTQLLSISAQRAITDLRREVEQHVMRLPVSFFDNRRAGELVTRILNDAEGIRNLVGTGLVQLVGGALTAVCALAVLFWLNWHLTVWTLAALLAFGGVMAVAFTRLRPLFRQRNEIQSQVTGRLAEALGGARIVKAYTAEKREDLVFAKGVHQLFRLVAKTLTATSAVAAGSSLLFGAVGVLMLVMGGRAVLAGTMTLGDAVSYVFFTGLVVAPMVQIAAIGTQITEAFAGLDRIRELRHMATEAAEDEQRAAVGRLSGDVRFEHVHFAYQEGKPVLSDVSFVAPAGSTTALVGSSGSGKSTLIGLVMAFHRPQAGRILVDGRDLASLKLHDYRSRLGIVLQDNFLFDGTIAENIAYARPHASRDEIREAARIAHCEDFVAGFPDGYETVIGERGVKLSGGQRQRVAIARAILADPTILILDEATSSLDSESEAAIQAGLAALRQGRTTFVIAHRLSTIRAADQILVLEAGEIVERGTHGELMALGGRYRELHDRQYRFELDRFINPGEDFTPEPPERPKLGTADASRL